MDCSCQSFYKKTEFVKRVSGNTRMFNARMFNLSERKINKYKYFTFVPLIPLIWWQGITCAQISPLGYNSLQLEQNPQKDTFLTSLPLKGSLE